MGAPKLVLYGKNTYGVHMTPEQASEYRRVYFETYPGLKEWHAQCSYEIKYLTPQYTKTLSGRKRIFSPDKLSPNALRFTAYINTQDQGTGGDITKRAIAKCLKAFKGTEVKLILQVHDEIVLEAPEDQAEWAAKVLNDCMVSAGKQFIKKVPVLVEVSIADSWGKAK